MGDIGGNPTGVGGTCVIWTGVGVRGQDFQGRTGQKKVKKIQSAGNKSLWGVAKKISVSVVGRLACGVVEPPTPMYLKKFVSLQKK